MVDNMVIKLIKRSLVFSFFVIAMYLLLIEDYMPYIKGYIFGLLVGILVFKLLVNSSKKAINMSLGSANNYARRQYFIRMSIYAVVLIISSKADYLNILSTFLGLIMIKISILYSTVFKKDL